MRSSIPIINKTDKKGSFIKPCPGTPKHVCCGYKIIDLAHGCNLGCTYCILNYYFQKNILTVFTNREKIFYELENFLEKKKGITRFGTGEFTDSLLFENDFPFYHELVPYIAEKRNAVLEIKTKTVNIDRLLDIKNHDNTIVSWSLNSDYIAQQEERLAPKIKKRINSAFQVQEAGYRLAFHFDPIVIHDGWEEGYKKTVDEIFKKINPESIVYVSMGTLRFIPEMVEFMNRVGASYIDGEFIKGADNKMRYFRPLRTWAYKKIKTFLLEYLSEDIIYMCMESPTVWEDVFSISNMNSQKLRKRLDRACFDKFDIICD